MPEELFSFLGKLRQFSYIYNQACVSKNKIECFFVNSNDDFFHSVIANTKNPPPPQPPAASRDKDGSLPTLSLTAGERHHEGRQVGPDGRLVQQDGVLPRGPEAEGDVSLPPSGYLDVGLARREGHHVRLSVWKVCHKT